MTGDRVLVTGAGGFIGSHLAADQLVRGHRVVACDINLDRVTHLADAGRFELLEADIADPAIQRRALEGVDVVYHLAAAHLGVSVAEAEFQRVNVDAVGSLIDASLAAGVGRFVHCSSVGVFGTVQNPPLNEDAPCHPEIAYEQSKLAGERLVAAAVEDKGLPAVIIRPVWVYGPGCPRTQRLFRAISRGRFLVAGRGDALRHCIYVRDMVRAFALAATAEGALGQVIIVGDNEAVMVRELVDEIANATGSRRPPTVPFWLLKSAAWLAELAFWPLGAEPPISTRTLKFFSGNTAFDITRARRLLGYESAYDLASGLEETQRILSMNPPWRLPLPPPKKG